MLAVYAHRPDVIVLALPRGGVPVGYEVAMALGAPLDVFVVRKLGVPGHEELAMGAIASGGVRVLDRGVMQLAEVGEAEMERVTAIEQREVERRERQYRGDRPFPDLRGKVVILTDDGLATGSTMRAAVAALRQEGPTKVVVVPNRRRRHRLRGDAESVLRGGPVVRGLHPDDRQRSARLAGARATAGPCRRLT
jgi:putative phosphoribosyl transferase